MTEKAKERAVLTVVGRDRVGIIAAVTTLLASYGANVEEISQTIVRGIFNMIMILDFTGVEQSLDDLRAELKPLGESLGVSINIQHTAIFDSMHRI